MRMRLHGRTLALLVGTLALFQWSLTAQSPSVATNKSAGAAPSVNPSSNVPASCASPQRWLPGMTCVPPFSSSKASTATMVDSDTIGRGRGSV